MQISLEPEMQRRAKERAGQLGISLAAYVRRLLARDLERPRRRVDPSAVFDLGGFGGSDVAQNKDDMIGQAVSAQVLGRKSTG